MKGIECSLNHFYYEEVADSKYWGMNKKRVIIKILMKIKLFSLSQYIQLVFAIQIKQKLTRNIYADLIILSFC